MGTGSSDAFSVGLNSFMLFVGACNIFDESSRFSSRRDVELMVPAIKQTGDGEDVRGRGRSKRALYRFEFMEAILRLALNKFKAGGKSATPAQAVQLLMEVNILPTLGPAGETVRSMAAHAAPPTMP